MTVTPDDFYRPWEFQEIKDWGTFQTAINTLTDRYRGSRLVWRGARNAAWGVHSSLARALNQVNGHYPTESDMVGAETRILNKARHDWRFDGQPALEIFAQLQHFGGPTRLLDVTENPLIALWFATEEPRQNEGTTDGRMFAFSTPTVSDVKLNSNWNVHTPHWHKLKTEAERRRNRWGTGLGRRFWRPPVYHSRIGAQSAGFLIDGAPIEAQIHGLGRKSPDTEEHWSVDEMRVFSSLPLKLTNIRRGELEATAAPVFTYRILESAKSRIRDQLQLHYGYRPSSIYSDIFGLADYLRTHPGEIAGMP